MNGCSSDAESERRAGNGPVEFLPCLGTQLFGIVRAIDGDTCRENHRRRDYRASKRTSARLIDTRHKKTAAPEPTLVFEQVLGPR